MKVLIWVLCFFANALITTVLKEELGIGLGAIPTILLFGGTIWLARTLCKKWDKHKKSKKATEVAENKENSINAETIDLNEKTLNSNIQVSQESTTVSTILEPSENDNTTCDYNIIKDTIPQSNIKSKVKLCCRCGRKRIFQYDVVIICALVVVIVLISSILLSQYQKNNPNTSNTNTTETNNITSNSNSNIESEHTNFYSGLNKSNYTHVTITDLYNNPHKYHREYVSVSAYNAFYCYREPTYSENFYDLYLIQNLSSKIDNSLSGLESSGLSQTIAFYDLTQMKHPHIVARIFEQNATNVLSGSNISSSSDLTNKHVTVYGYFTYNPNTEGYITDPEVFQLEVHAYEFH